MYVSKNVKHSSQNNTAMKILAYKNGLSCYLIIWTNKPYTLKYFFKTNEGKLE